MWPAGQLFTAARLPGPVPAVGCDIRRMECDDDPYDRLATLPWLLKPADGARLLVVADLLAEMRLAALDDPGVP